MSVRRTWRAAKTPADPPGRARDGTNRAARRRRSTRATELGGYRRRRAGGGAPMRARAGACAGQHVLAGPVVARRRGADRTAPGRGQLKAIGAHLAHPLHHSNRLTRPTAREHALRSGRRRRRRAARRLEIAAQRESAVVALLYALDDRHARTGRPARPHRGRRSASCGRTARRSTGFDDARCARSSSRRCCSCSIGGSIAAGWRGPPTCSGALGRGEPRAARLHRRPARDPRAPEASGGRRGRAGREACGPRPSR